MNRGWAPLITAALAACSSAGPLRSSAAEKSDTAPASDPAAAQPRLGPVAQGELPWWHELEPRIYRLGPERTALAVGRASEHRHAAEGFMRAKVRARIAVRKASEPVRFSGTMPEPELLDLFITRDRTFWALYSLQVPEEAEVFEEVLDAAVPDVLNAPGRRRVGRHVFEDEQHLFLECEVEGPVANPDWGRTRASAFLFKRK